ncbi:MAG: valine--tRNA ligase [Anaerolineae bacterium]|nr:valine--tRNA ligase [Anaerolineae bacterium]
MKPIHEHKHKPKEMSQTFDFNEAEPRLYVWWESNGWFKPEIAGPDAEPFVISIPPPNVTGALHQGHAMFVTLEDLMIRYERMRGRAALWVPGSDHAGIATQLQVENMLREEGASREGVGRAEFLRRTWQWKAEKGGRIYEQLRRLGASCDWDRERFTLDDGLSRAVREAFVRLRDDGLIYRGPRLINWSPGLQTAVSDLEVERIEQQDVLYYFRYPIAGEPIENGLPVATTRPETILGDTAVAVHPADPRYKQYIGKTCLVPMLNRPIPVIADEYVDIEFGTGALKITPGHDPADYEIGERHGLEVVSILNKDVTLNANAGPYAGLDRFEARARLWADMEAAGMVIKTEPYTHSVPVAQRGGELIEPMVSTQWFVKIKPLAERAVEAVRDGRIKIVPEHFEKVYFNWLENIEDWCISRQLWWGHRIPAWHCADCGEITVLREDPTTCAHCGSARLEQDPDVLDTWFSSGLWPFSTLGWPDETPDLKRYYPTSIMETGYDILFFWVARMIMMGLWFTNDIPFHTVYLHGLVRDADGRKMSKTYNNVVDPIEVMDEYGTDALRFTLVTGSTPGNDMNLDIKRIEAMRNFGNKIWQMARFITANLPGETPAGAPDAAARRALSLPERWIMSRLARLTQSVQRLFDGYLYGEAGRQLYDFLWGEFADWYIEISKTTLYAEGQEDAKQRTRQVLVHVLETCLRMLHPFIPYITEAVWQHLPHEGETIMLARWPQADESFIDEAAEAQMNMLIDLIRGIRNARKEFDVAPSQGITAIFRADGSAPLIESNREMFRRLANVTDLSMMDGSAAAPDQAAAVVSGEVTCFLPLAGMIDIDAERARLAKALEAIEAHVARTEAQLANANFVTKAKPEVVERTRARLNDLKAERESVAGRLEALK